MKRKDKPFISVVTTLYQSERYVVEFYERMTKALCEITDKFEIIFVNDDPDQVAMTKAVALQQSDNRVVVVDLSRNFGQHKASMTGMSYAAGDFIFLVEVDLEESPEWIIDFYKKIVASNNADVIYGVQSRRKGDIAEQFTGFLFYKLFNFFSDVKMPENHVITRLMTKRYVDALLKFKEKELFLGGVFELVGFCQEPIFVNKLSHSKTTYTFRKKIVLLLNAITSFSTVPLTLIFWLGVTVSAFSIAILGFTLAKWFFMSITPGWTSVIASIWAVGGVTVLSIGVIGLYIKKVLEEVKERPYTVVRRVYSSRHNHSEEN